MAQSDQSKKEQPGARVPSRTYELFKNLVKHKQGGIRGQLGPALNDALKLYIATQLIQDADTDACAMELDDEEQAKKEYCEIIDEVSPELLQATAVLQAGPPTENQHHRERDRSELMQQTASRENLYRNQPETVARDRRSPNTFSSKPDPSMRQEPNSPDDNLEQLIVNHFEEFVAFKNNVNDRLNELEDVISGHIESNGDTNITETGEETDTHTQT